MHTFTSINDIEALIQKNDDYRTRSLNLIASENLISPTVRRFYDNELIARYGCYETGNLAQREYTGNKYIYEIEYATQELAKEVFHAEYVDLRPLSGHTAGLATILALTPPGQCLLEYHLRDWGHGMMAPACDCVPHLKQSLRIAYFRFVGDYEFDLSDLERQIDEEKPVTVILGSSGLLFPEPVAEIKKICAARNITLIADASHVSGLIAGGVYPNPLEHGADIMFLSTHKSFPGPQGGMILSNDKSLIEKVGNTLSPGMVTSHHVFRLPALAAALLEVKKFGKAYGEQIIKNSQALGAALDAQGVEVLAKDRGYSATHILLADIRKFGSSQEIAKYLESGNIFVSDDFGSGGTQIRLGTAEITRRGMKESDMQSIALLIAKALHKNESEAVLSEKVAALVSPFTHCAYAI